MSDAMSGDFIRGPMSLSMDGKVNKYSISDMLSITLEYLSTQCLLSCFTAHMQWDSFAENRKSVKISRRVAYRIFSAIYWRMNFPDRISPSISN